MIDKNKLVEYLKNEIDSCKVVGNASDMAIIWECERILKRIELGMFDSDK
jgi:hypothetical protein